MTTGRSKSVSAVGAKVDASGDVKRSPNTTGVRSDTRDKSKHREIFQCICGNGRSGSGFLPCDRNGYLYDISEGSWEYLYRCERCGRMIDGLTSAVVGRSVDPSARFLTDAEAKLFPDAVVEPETSRDEKVTMRSLQRELAMHSKAGLYWHDGELRCECGNEHTNGSACPIERGFAFCNSAGDDVQIGSGYERCMQCGRVIHLSATVEVNRVVAHRPELIRASNATPTANPTSG